MTDTEQFSSTLDPAVAALLTRNDAGLVPAVVQDASSGRVLMMAWMNDQALHRTLTTGRGTYWSRSRNRFWVKGEESGHIQWVREVRLDCDGDTLLLQVDQVGPACHTGTTSCFDAHVLLPFDAADRPLAQSPASPQEAR
ncbi:MAG: phosphoribosyl-AMP cyclohydrolase [Propionibacteriaceae bacterium]|nr:phosphoribosyl-AMP cyclohydrolase [Propionibacteriaceae bacterium]